MRATQRTAVKRSAVARINATAHLRGNCWSRRCVTSLEARAFTLPGFSAAARRPLLLPASTWRQPR
jgi:hypothetical protein